MSQAVGPGGKGTLGREGKPGKGPGAGAWLWLGGGQCGGRMREQEESPGPRSRVRWGLGRLCSDLGFKS